MKKLLRKLTAVVSAAAVAIAGVNFGGIGGLNLTARAEAAGTLDISAGSIVITATGYTVGGGDETAYTGDYTITGSTETNTITVKKDVSANITLNCVDIQVSGCAFKIEDNSTGNVTIDLKGENTLKSGSGAGLQKNGTGDGIGKLTIESTDDIGKLNAAGGSDSAGIGGSNRGSGSNITINSGTVTATGNWSAGIGGGFNGSGSNITISGGTVTANGGKQAAGIGGGAGGGSGSDITISGGNITAIGGTYGAGIGGGANGSGSHITISGGNITARGTQFAAGIGGGNGGSGSNITISGGNITATGGDCGAGIGGGKSGTGSNITISGGIVSAYSCWGAAYIGSGYSGSGSSNITISGGSVKASPIGCTPTLADGTTKVYLYKIDISSSPSSITIDGAEYPTTHNTETYIYPYLSVGFHFVEINGTEKVIYIADDGTITDPVATDTAGAFEVYGGTSGDDYDYSGSVLTVKTTTPLMIKNASTGSTTDRIEVADGISADITLAGVDIALSGLFIAAFNISDESSGDVTITLAGGSVNTLKSSSRCAGLQKNGGAGSGKLTITGTGTLIAEGGDFAAGIGGGYNENGYNITINNSVVSATGGQGEQVLAEESRLRQAQAKPVIL